LRIAEEEWLDAAVVGGNLCNTLLTLGEVAGAVQAAELAVEHADQSFKLAVERGHRSYKEDAQRALRRATLAIALAVAGNLTGASQLFAAAEDIRKRRRPYNWQLPSLPGYHYGDLWLARGEAEEALKRGHRQLFLAQADDGFGLHDIGLAQLLIGRAEDALARLDAGPMLNEAVDGLRQSGRDDHVPKALLARAAHWRRLAGAGETGLIEAIRADLDETEDIAGEEMRLYLTDLALERARLALDVPAAFDSPAAARAEAEAQTAKAAQLIAETGYHRRDGELTDLRTRLAA
jgi:hypothetical protein